MLSSFDPQQAPRGINQCAGDGAEAFPACQWQKLRAYSLLDKQHVRHVSYERHSWKSWAQRSHVSPRQAVGEAGHGLPCSCPTAQESQPAPRAGRRLPQPQPQPTPLHPTLLGPVYRQALLRAGASIHQGSEQRAWPTCEFPQLLASSGKYQTQAAHLPQPTHPHRSFCKPHQKEKQIMFWRRDKAFQTWDLLLWPLPPINHAKVR